MRNRLRRFLRHCIQTRVEYIEPLSGVIQKGYLVGYIVTEFTKGRIGTGQGAHVKPEPIISAIIECKDPGTKQWNHSTVRASNVKIL